MNIENQQINQSISQQALAKKSLAEQKLAQIKEPINLIGSEMAFSGLSGIGSYLSKKSGIKAFEGIGDAIKKDGFQKGFQNILAKGKKEIVEKGNAKLGDALKKIQDSKGEIQKALGDKVSDLQGKVAGKVADVQGKVADIQGKVAGKVADIQGKAQVFKTKAEKDLATGRENFENKVNDNLKRTRKKVSIKIDPDRPIGDQIKEARQSTQSVLDDTEKLGRGEISDRIKNLDDDIKDKVLSRLRKHTEKITKNDTKYVPTEEDNESLRSKAQELMEKGETAQAQRRSGNEPNPDKQPEPQPEVDDDDDEMPPLQEQDDEGNLIPLADQQSTPTDDDSQALFDKIRGNLVTKTPADTGSASVQDLVPKTKQDPALDEPEDLVYNDDGTILQDEQTRIINQRYDDIQQGKVDLTNPLEQTIQKQQDTLFKTPKPQPQPEPERTITSQQSSVPKAEDIDLDTPSLQKFQTRTTQIKQAFGGSDLPIETSDLPTFGGVQHSISQYKPTINPKPDRLSAENYSPLTEKYKVTADVRDAPILNQPAPVVKEEPFPPPPDFLLQEPDLPPPAPSQFTNFSQSLQDAQQSEDALSQPLNRGSIPLNVERPSVTAAREAQQSAPAPKPTPEPTPEPVSEPVADDVASDLTKATEVSEIGDENPFGDILTAGLGIASLFASAFTGKGEDKPVMPSIQSGFQLGVSGAVPT